LVDLILVLVAAEALALFAYHRCTGRGIAPRGLIANLLAGAFLLLALRGALVGADWVWIGLPISAALLAHLSDLRHRWLK
jgi:hypothetical protein